jgi:2-amino-4-hydroxy-6-hydroxymethyldihydropteridine diphosphokinase
MNEPVMNQPVTAYIALGANLGDREQNIHTALQELGAMPGTQVLRISTLLANPAVGGPANSPDFLNAAAEIRTTLDAQSLLSRMLQIEHNLGRDRREKWSPRTIDLDLLLYDDQIIRSDHLTVPHPLMHTRRFVLEPLAEIAARVVHPVLRLTIADLLRMAEQRATS